MERKCDICGKSGKELQDTVVVVPPKSMTAICWPCVGEAVEFYKLEVKG